MIAIHKGVLFLTKEEILLYVNTIVENLKSNYSETYKSTEVDLKDQRKIVVNFEKKLLNEMTDQHFNRFIEMAINCAFGEFPFEDLIILYETTKTKPSD